MERVSLWCFIVLIVDKICFNNLYCELGGKGVFFDFVMAPVMEESAGATLARLKHSCYFSGLPCKRRGEGGCGWMTRVLS